MAEGVETTNWMETIIFLPPWQSWGEGGGACGYVPVHSPRGHACTLPTPRTLILTYEVGDYLDVTDV